MNAEPIQILRGGKVAPLTKFDVRRNGEPGRFDGGVYRSNGEICSLGTQLKAAHLNQPAMPPPEAEERIAGHHVYAGMLQNRHFGHFMSESLSRLWAFRHLDRSFNSVVYYCRDREDQVAGFVTETINLIAPEIAIRTVTVPTEFEVLAVPKQLATNGFIFGHPMIRLMLADLRNRPGSGAEKIYVSRSRLSLGDGGLLLEDLIERNLAAQGYEIVYPEKLSVEQQIEKYNAAKYLIFAEGSALHLYALVAKPTQKLFVIWRRKFDGTFVWQIKSFNGPPVEGGSCVKELWVPEGGEIMSGKAVLDFPELRSQLREFGFIKAGDWEDPDPKVLRNALDRLSARLNRPFLRHPHFDVVEARP